jgi:tetratricopeptide (TPR) repeat protein
LEKSEGRNPKAEGSAEKSGLWYVLALFLFALGLMSKPMLVTLPFVLLLLDYWPLGRWEGKSKVQSPESKVKSQTSEVQVSMLGSLVLEKIPFFILSAVSSVITFLVQKEAGAIRSFAKLPLGGRIENGFVAYARYLGKAFWPQHLALPYLDPGHWPWVKVAGAAALVAGLSVVAVCSARRLPFLYTGWFWFIGMLVPVLGLVQAGTQSLADRYTYLPLAGLFVALVWGAASVLSKISFGPWLTALAALALLAACAAGTRTQLSYWRTSETLFRHALEASRDNYVAHDNLGFYLYEHGLPEEAIEHYHEALRINPSDANTLNNLGTALAMRKQFGEAIKCYEAALLAKPGYTDAHVNLGAALNQIGRSDEAIEQYAQALRYAPEDAQAHNNLANVLMTKGRADEAVEHYRQALRSDPNLTQAWNNLGLALAEKGQYAEAIPCFQQALRLKPNNAQLHGNLGDVLAAMGAHDQAGEHYVKALELAPNDPDLNLALGRSLARSGRREEAAGYLRRALELKPDFEEARRELRALSPP